ncbi:outer membrane protein assembly factor BamB family protein [Kribbella kalugense]|uniref:Putative metal-dependent HD superfamily phosphohydrolase n=1 Tax=Kribbella kalugense TaxID=2512221 RepID=A0A4R7ZHN5_9ACTN|nr:PQQ-binding-like beta-propeller repeat protein [Kribbella kalugense]TDW17209.1 putative metal-dependent HD superfamily phosphohydrolase [Kribbella kalugense]
MAGLRELWDDVVPDAGELADELVRRYGGKRVAYRDRYLIGVLTALDSLEQLCTDPEAVRLAAWFHRAAHDKGSTAAEDAEASARLAEELLPKYGVNPVQTAEVARLVRLTDPEDANGEVLLDALNSVYADPRYVTHASEVRRDSQYDVRGRRQQVEALLASDRIYRTQLAHDRYEETARAHLTDELATLDGMTPHPWRGWQRAGLAVTAVLTALVAFVAGVSAIRQPWRVPEYSGDSVWPAVLLMLAALASVIGVSWAVRRNARIVAAIPVAVGVIGVLFVWLSTPDTNGASGVGRRVPLLMILSILLIVAGTAAFAATRFTPNGSRNRGQRLAGLGAFVVVVLALFLVIDPAERAYLVGANEYLEDQHQPANLDVRSELTGEPLWSNPGGLSVQQVVMTADGIAVARGRGAVEMLDPATGKSRWRYLRSDTDDSPHLYPLNGGRQVLLSYDDLGYLVLDADTGKRTAAWPSGTRDYDIQDNDPLVTGKTVSKGSDKLYGTNTDGSNRWKYEPGRCTGISATGTADVAVVELGHSCGNEPSQLVGLNLENGKKLWTKDAVMTEEVAAGGLFVAIQSGRLVGIDPHSGEEKWRSEIPAEWGCPVRVEPAGNRVALISCPSQAQSQSHTVVRAVDAGTGQTVETTSVEMPYQREDAVTSDGRVILMGNGPRGCRLAAVGDGPVVYRQLDSSINCGFGATVAGNLVLIRSTDALIALR